MRVIGGTAPRGRSSASMHDPMSPPADPPRAARARSARRVAAAALALLAGMLVAAGGALAYVNRELAREDPFTARLSAALEDPAVRRVVADRTVDELTRGRAVDALALRPALAAAVGRVVATDAYAAVAAATARVAHRALVADDRAVALRLRLDEPRLTRAVGAVSPAAAERAAATRGVVVARLAAADGALTAGRTALDVAAWWWAVVAAGAACAVAALGLAGAGRHVLAWLAAGLVAGAAIVAAAVVVGGRVVAGKVPAGSRRDAVDAVWDALLGDLRSAALVVALGGLVACVLAAGPPARARRRQGRPGRRPAEGGGRALAAAGAGVALAVAVAAVIPFDRPALPAGAAAGGACNGSRALCDRRLDEVVLAGTHNSYAAADEPGWSFANQRRPIARQLEDGIRLLLLDVHTGVADAGSGRVRTDLRADGTTRNKVVQQLSPAALRAADRAGGRVGATPLEGPRGPYLCHTLCELGSQPLDQELAVLRRFLDANPRDVLVVVFEPYVTPAVIRDALRRTGLLEDAPELDRDAPLPTLGDLVDAGTRLVVFTEEDGGAYPWYLPAFSFIQDTPLGARAVRAAL